MFLQGDDEWKTVGYDWYWVSGHLYVAEDETCPQSQRRYFDRRLLEWAKRKVYEHVLKHIVIHETPERRDCAP